jgi:flagellar biosynthesis/type III secretory pathway protein FliH
MFQVVDPMYRDALRAKLALLGSRAEESAMTIAEQLHEEGRQQGHQEGRQQGRQEALATAVRSLLIGKFHMLEASDEARLRAATVEALDRYLRRVLSASSPADVFED